MIQRCTNPKHPRYRDWGGRGIAVCDRWLNSFDDFLADMGQPPPGTTIDRIDNDSGYEPGNCRWATRKRQSNNRRDNRRFAAFGRTMTAMEWADISGIPYSRLSKRIRDGLPAEQVFVGANEGFQEHLSSVPLEDFTRRAG